MKLNKHILFQLPTFTACSHPPLLESEARNDSKPSHESYPVRVGNNRAEINGKYSHSLIYVQC